MILSNEALEQAAKAAEDWSSGHFCANFWYEDDRFYDSSFVPTTPERG